MLVGVTISGADKNTDVDEMRRLSAEYPFLEWALLAGGHREIERPRYPSDATLDAMMGAAQAAHLCGDAMRDVMLNGRIEMLRRLGRMRRIQLNAAGNLNAYATPIRCTMTQAYAEPALRAAPTIIGQVMGITDLTGLETIANAFDVQPFFDASGGRGRILSDDDILRYADMARGWTREHPNAVVGFAGGITPENVRSVVERIIKAYGGPFWIDMESGVRTSGRENEDRLRIDLVERVLDLCEPFVRTVSAMPTPSTRPESLRRTTKERERWWEREMFFGVGDLPTGEGLAPTPAAPSGSSGDFSIGGRVWPGASKVVEEAGELLQVLGELIATHGHTTHFDGSDLRARLVDELADVEAAMRFFREVNLTPEERTRIETRGIEKHALFHAWHQQERNATCSDCATGGTCRPSRGAP